MAHVSALGLVSMLQQMGVEAKARATEQDRVNATTCMPGTYDNQSSSTTKRPCSSPPTFFETYGADVNQSGVYTLETWWRFFASKGQPVSMSVGENITSSVNFCFVARRWVCPNDKKLGFCWLRKSRSRVIKTSLFWPSFLVMYTADRKKWRISALEILSLCSSVEDTL